MKSPRAHIAITHSALIRARSRTLRHITTYPDLRQKTIHLRSDNREPQF